MCLTILPLDPLLFSSETLPGVKEWHFERDRDTCIAVNPPATCIYLQHFVVSTLDNINAESERLVDIAGGLE
jgi:hypothetical protein